VSGFFNFSAERDQLAPPAGSLRSKAESFPLCIGFYLAYRPNANLLRKVANGGQSR
jgi:hypothetical protein